MIFIFSQSFSSIGGLQDEDFNYCCSCEVKPVLQPGPSIIGLGVFRLLRLELDEFGPAH